MAAIAESFRTLRSHILLRLNGDKKCILVTSAQPGDGKSITCVNLARVLAESGKTVLLIDAALRRPSLHRMFGLSNETGLSDVLQSGADASGSFHRIGEGLTFLAGGAVPADPQQLLTGEGLDRLLKSVRASFDVIVLDSPPVLTCPDTALMAPRMDGVIIVMRAGRTTAADVALLRRRLDAVGAPLWGSVLNYATGDAAGPWLPPCRQASERAPAKSASSPEGLPHQACQPSTAI